MEGVEVPSFFLCPISLQIMRDPVTLPTGSTYDRETIERWIFAGKHTTCPLTKQSLTPADCDLLTPNHTLRRLVQAWCIANASHGVERFPTPRPPVTKSLILALIDDSNEITSSLQKLKAIVSESERNKRVFESTPGAVGFLASIVEKRLMDKDVLEEALNILYSVQMSEQGLMELLARRVDFIHTLTSVLQTSNYQCRAYASLLLKSMVSVISPARLATSLNDEFFIEIVKVLRDTISYQSTKAALQILSAVAPWGSNKVRAVEAGAIPVLIELLLDEPEKKATEMMLVVLARLSECAEGRAEIVGHAAGIAVVSKKLVRVSVAASERAVRVMHSIAKFSPTAAVLKEMVEVGVVSKMCLLIQADCGSKTKERVKEMLRWHARVWGSSPCISPYLHGSYPC